MKKFLSLLVVVLFLALTACAPSDQGSSSEYSSGNDYSAADQPNQDSGYHSNVSSDSKIIGLTCYQQGQAIVDVTSVTGIKLNAVVIPGQTFGSYIVWEWQDETGATHALMYSETTPCELVFAN
jgi:ABC-type oligopeptide transport system substrate-binding subunit